MQLQCYFPLTSIAGVHLKSQYILILHLKPESLALHYVSLCLWSVLCIVDGHCRWGEHQRENQQEPFTIQGSRSPNSKLLFFRSKTSVCLCPLFFLFLPKVSLVCNITLPLWESIYLFFMLYEIIFIMQSAFFPVVSLLCCWPWIQLLQVVFSSSVTNEPISLSISVSFNIWFVLSVALKRVL